MGGRSLLCDASGLWASFPMMASTTTEEGLGSTPAGSGPGSTGARGRARQLALATGAWRPRPSLALVTLKG